MRYVLVAAGFAAVVGFAGPVSAAPTAGMAVDSYSFAGGRDAVVMAPLESGRSVAQVAGAPTAFSKGDLDHAFATWGYAD